MPSKQVSDFVQALLDKDPRMRQAFAKKEREKKQQDFEKTLLKELKEKYKVISYPEQCKYSIWNTIHGIVDYYPRADRILIRKDNHWISDGLAWINQNLL